MTGATRGMRPLVIELVPPPDPLTACVRLAGLPRRAWLDSAGGATRVRRYSFLSADPWATVEQDAPDALAALRAILAPHRVPPIPGLPPFQGGAIGYLAYEYGRRLERVPAPRADDLRVPDVWFGLYDWTIAWDHVAGRAWIISTGAGEGGSGKPEGRAADRLDTVRQLLAAPVPLAAVEDFARGGAPCAARHPVPGLPGVTSVLARAEYLRAVERIRSCIEAGDVFQVNLTQRMEAPLLGSALDFYRRLRRVNPGPFAAFLEPGNWAIASASPERFLYVDTDGGVETRPIKGTRPRNPDTTRDAALARELAGSEKDRAENVMIVDVLRNDLSRACALHTVLAPELCVVESYATVHHLVSTVTGRLAPTRDALDLLAAAFPGGSVTGAPKIRAMEIAAELEPVARGVYCGAIAYFSVTGALDSSVAIRTATLLDGTAYFGVGGGVVADSDPEREYGETIDKARGMAAALTPRRRSGVSALAGGSA